MTEQYLDDGFGNLFATCGRLCRLEIVRPGKVQCPESEFAPCMVYGRKIHVRKMYGFWVIICPCCIWHSETFYVTHQKAMEDALVHANTFHADGNQPWWYSKAQPWWYSPELPGQQG